MALTLTPATTAVPRSMCCAFDARDLMPSTMEAPGASLDWDRHPAVGPDHQPLRWAADEITTQYAAI